MPLSDNAPGRFMAEVAQYGTATVKRAYGDWTTPQLGSWKEVLHVHAIQPVQQFSYTSGKNATDSALIIDARNFGFRNFGIRKLSELVKAKPYLVVKEVPIAAGSQQMHLYVRVKEG